MHCSDLPEPTTALPISEPLPSTAINCAVKTTSHLKATGARPGCEFAEISSVTCRRELW